VGAAAGTGADLGAEAGDVFRRVLSFIAEAGKFGVKRLNRVGLHCPFRCCNL
jgi:hypothetical protein